ncbi:hypothetical protein ACLKA7_016877 [Drosophila subpalustris]
MPGVRALYAVRDEATRDLGAGTLMVCKISPSSLVNAFASQQLWAELGPRPLVAGSSRPYHTYKSSLQDGHNGIGNGNDSGNGSGSDTPPTIGAGNHKDAPCSSSSSTMDEYTSALTPHYQQRHRPLAAVVDAQALSVHSPFHLSLMLSLYTVGGATAKLLAMFHTIYCLFYGLGQHCGSTGGGIISPSKDPILGGSAYEQYFNNGV